MKPMLSWVVVLLCCLLALPEAADAAAAAQVRHSAAAKARPVAKVHKVQKAQKALNARNKADARQAAAPSVRRAAQAQTALRGARQVRPVQSARAPQAGRSARLAARQPSRALAQASVRSRSRQVASVSTRSASARVLRTMAAAAPVATAAALAAVPSGSVGQQLGLHAEADPLALRSGVALVVDQDTNEVLFSKNPTAVLPIASITKLMTALVVVEARQPLDEPISVSDADIDTEKGSRSRLAVGTQLSRGEMLHLALMSSENRAANALGRHYPGGLAAAVAAMNRKAVALGMHDTHYVEPTGLSSQNRSSARDLALLVKAAYQVPLLRELSTSPEAQVAVGNRLMNFRNTNGLVHSPEWAIGLQKTGYIVEAGRCLVMQAQLAGRKLIMVLLDSAGKYSRLGDAERIRKWLDAVSADTGALHRPG